MLQCIAVDDEPLALELLEDNISKLPYLKLIGSFNNPLEAMKILQDNTVDLIFIDIQMPGLNGLQFIQSIMQKPMVILVTAYEKYALDGFALNVVDYLVKPVELNRFIKACGKALELYQLKKNQQEPGLYEPAPYIFLNIDYSQVKVVFADIMWIEGLKDYLKIYLRSSSRPLVVRMSIKSIEEQLPSSMFLRIHKSYVISKEYVTAVRKNSVFIDVHEFPVGDSFKDSLTRLLGKSL